MDVFKQAGYQNYADAVHKVLTDGKFMQQLLIIVLCVCVCERERESKRKREYWLIKPGVD